MKILLTTLDYWKALLCYNRRYCWRFTIVIVHRNAHTRTHVRGQNLNELTNYGRVSFFFVHALCLQIIKPCRGSSLNPPTNTKHYQCAKLGNPRLLSGRRGSRALHKFLRNFGPGSVDPDVASVKERRQRGRAHSLCAPERVHAATVRIVEMNTVSDTWDAWDTTSLNKQTPVECIQDMEGNVRINQLCFPVFLYTQSPGYGFGFGTIEFRYCRGREKLWEKEIDSITKNMWKLYHSMMLWVA